MIDKLGGGIGLVGWCGAATVGGLLVAMTLTYRPRLVLAALNKVKRYPRGAQFRRQQAVPYIRFVIDREGRVLSSTLERSCGERALDEEAVALPKRAQPLSKPPESHKGGSIELVVPVEFFLGR